MKIDLLKWNDLLLWISRMPDPPWYDKKRLLGDDQISGFEGFDGDHTDTFALDFSADEFALGHPGAISHFVLLSHS